MVFSSTLFLFLFLPCVLGLYFLIPRRFRVARNMVLLVFSLIFYGVGEPKYIVIMLLSILINYASGGAVYLVKKRSETGAKWIVALSVALNLGMFVYFKYTGFLIENINGLFSLGIPVPQIVMPIGISFFTFQGMSYVFDVYFGEARVQKNILNVALYISLFPQLIAGPIVRYQTVADEIMDRNENLPEAASGVRRFCCGLGKKILLSNAMGLIADGVFGMAPGAISMPLAWVGAIAYTFQIYFDFSGYSDMAIGLGRIFGFHFLENFDHPYISRSITEFWRRWHISLGTWFRDYVYIPLGGNRVSPVKQIRNILVVWLLTGIWHGAAWNFVMWGLYFAVLLILEKKVLKKYLERMPRVFSHLYALLLIIFGWVLFRSPTLAYAGQYLGRMFDFSTLVPFQQEAGYYLIEYAVAFVLCILFSLPLRQMLKSRLTLSREGTAALAETGYSLFALAIFVLSVVFLVNSSFNPFIYFRF